MKTNLRQQLLASTLLVGAYASPALAQVQSDADPASAPPSQPVEAQPVPSVSATGEPVEQAGDIVVTGSRIPQPNLDSAAPVTVVNSQDIKLSGATRIDDVLNQLPSAYASQGPGLPNPSTGTAEIDLRYLGAKRTMTLVNGRRLTPGDPNSSTQAGDVNMIPAFILQRVEVLTGGASSVYGADAVAGVVNFIIDKEFTGLRIDGQISAYQHNNDCPKINQGLTACDPLNARIEAGFQGFEYPTGSDFDGRAIDANIAFGVNFDDGRGHAVAYAGYRKQNEVYQSARDFSACTLNGTTTLTCGGSSFSAEGNFLLSDGFYTRGPNGTLLPGRTRYNFAPTNHWIRPDERYTAGAFADYEISPALVPYLEFMFMDDSTKAQIAPSGNFANTFSINCDNPFLSAQAFNIVCGNPGNLVTGFLGNFPLTDTDPDDGQDAPLTFFDARGNQYQQGFFQIFRRNVEGGPRINQLSHTSYRGVLGARGDLNPVLSYDASYQYGRTNYTQVYRNEFSASRLARSVNVVNVDDAGLVVPVGTPGSRIICRSVLDGSDPNCVPFNYFDAAGPSAEAVNYLNVFGVITGRTTEQIANINFTGELGEAGIQTPWAESGIGVNAGWEYRKETLSLSPDQEFQTGDLTGQGAPTLPVEGNFHVNEIFAEIQIPIVQKSFVDDLTLGAGYRKSWYKLSNGRSYDTDTYKISLEFAPIRDVRFRGSYNRAARAPNIVELFAPQFVGLDGATDPCATDVPITANQFGCIYQLQSAGIADPVAAGTTIFSNPSEQYNGLLGGVPTLTPEKATTKTVGVILQPRFVPNLAVTVDYWKIKLDDAIQGFGADTILADCVSNSTATVEAPSCALVHRDAGGSLWLTPDGYVRDLPSNVGRIRTDGVDVNASYVQRLGFGTLGFSFLGTRLLHYKVNNGIAPTYDCAGLYGTVCSGGTVASTAAMPKWRHKFRTTLSDAFGIEDLGISLNWRRVGKVRFETTSDDVALAGTPNDLNSHVKAQNYFDLAATITVMDSLNLRAGVNNIFDRTPPIIPTANGSCPAASCTGNTYPTTWDYLGRYLYAGFTLDFKPKRAPILPPPAEIPAPPPPPPPPPPPATQTCADGSVVLATEACPVPPPPPPPPPPAPERG